MRRIFPLFVCLLMATSALAQDSTSSTKSGGSPKAFESTQQLPEMKKLIETFSGRWRTTITVEKNFWFPVAGTANGRADIQAGPAGNSMTERQRSNSPLGDFAGFGTYWYDPQTKSYKGIWCDSMDPRGCGDMGSANWDGSNFIVTNDMQMEKGKMHVRETFSNISHDSFDFMIEAGMGDAPLKKMMSIHYQRASAASSDRE